MSVVCVRAHVCACARVRAFARVRILVHVRACICVAILNQLRAVLSGHIYVCLFENTCECGVHDKTWPQITSQEVDTTVLPHSGLSC